MSVQDPDRPGGASPHHAHALFAYSAGQVENLGLKKGFREAEDCSAMTLARHHGPHNRSLSFALRLNCTQYSTEGVKLF